MLGKIREISRRNTVREKIVSEIQRLAKSNGGQPPGRRLFETETGIPESAWVGKYWARWGDAVAEAGYIPNSSNQKLDEQFIFQKLAAVCRYYRRIPATMEMRLYKKIDPEFPNEKTILSHFGGKQDLLRRLAEWSRQQDDYEDIAEMLIHISRETAPAAKNTTKEGSVYLIKSGAHYKIGKSDNLERRVREVRTALPEVLTLVHSIRTDDPSGIEAYWHRRFDDRRANGEWFRLTNADVAAFKRRKYQ